ncbi:Phosphoserine transaminase [Savitreella phatthalungensis]
MPERNEIVNFGAGPAAMPSSVMRQAAKDLLNYADTGMGIGELSHRSSTCANRLQKVKEDLRNLIGVPDSHSILFMQGGGTTQFSATAYNLVAHWVAKEGAEGSKRIGDYIVTGAWSKKAVEEAKRLGIKTNIVADSRKANDGKFGVIPQLTEASYTPKDQAAYIWYCDNETIDGVEFAGLPHGIDSEVPLVCDMSSNFCSRRIDVAKYAVIYAGAQKNVGLAGITVVIVRNDILETRADADALRAAQAPIPPIMLDYATIAKNDSLYNTLPIFTLHVTGLVFSELLAKGGIEAIEKENAAKSDALYKALAAHPQARVIPSEGCRSRMNVVFTFGSEEADKRFVQQAEAKGMVQLKGHRSVGGLRASLYNAISLDQVNQLVAHVESTQA